MKWLSKINLIYGIAIMFVMVVLTVFVSWIGSVYGWGLNNILSADGIRWAVTNFIPNIPKSPIGLILLLMIAVSVAVESGLFHGFGKKSSLKQRRAVSIALAVALILLIVILLLLLPSNAVLLSPFGTISDSSFTRGFWMILCLAVIVVCNVYGYASGRFYNLKDCIDAHASLISFAAPYFVYLIVASQFMACIDYADILPTNNIMYVWIGRIIYFVPLVILIISWVCKDMKRGA